MGSGQWREMGLWVVVSGGRQAHPVGSGQWREMGLWVAVSEGRWALG